jgi:hypothetical protein
VYAHPPDHPAKIHTDASWRDSEVHIRRENLSHDRRDDDRASTPTASARNRLRRFWNPVLVLLGPATAMLLPEVLVRPGPASGDPLLPDHIAGYAPFTADVRDEPPGRGVLIFTSGSGEMTLGGTFQRIVVGADATSYRQTGRIGVLSPDGSSVLLSLWRKGLSIPIEAFDVVDLRTGSTRHLPIAAASEVIVYARSPNGRFVAYGHLAWPDPSPVGVSRRQATVRDDGWFSVLDLTNGSIVDYPGFVHASAVAFAPDSTTMAVQTGERVLVVDAAGQIQREVPRPTETLGLLPDVGWTPDGRFIAMVTYNFVGGGAAGVPIVGPQGQPTVRPAEVTLVDATGSGLAPRGPYQVSQSVLGWRSADSLVQFNGLTNELSEVSLADGHITTWP